MLGGIYLVWLLLSAGICEYSVSKRDDGMQLRIFNGEDTFEGELPFMALILANIEFSEDGGLQNICGGSLLSTSIVLTAAHCVAAEVMVGDLQEDLIYHPVNLEVYVGGWDMRVYGSMEQKKNVKGIIVHEAYDSVSVKNDIAMLILDSDVTTSSHVATIALPNDNDVTSLYEAGAAVTVAGWGTTEAGNTSEILQKLNYVMTGSTVCSDKYASRLQEGMMCTGVSPMTEHSGTGDSGGPLFTKKDNVWTQLGLVSWGPEEQTETTYDVNTNVNYFKSWITDNMALVSNYVGFLEATDSTQTTIYDNIRDLLYKTVTIAPKDPAKYTSITIKSGTLDIRDYVAIYDGDDVITNKMLGQLTGDISEKAFTATSTKGLTLAIVTSTNADKDSFSVEYKQVASPGTVNSLTCSQGFTACSDRYYCLNSLLLCDGSAQCIDTSDEQTAVCNSTNNGEGSASKSKNCSSNSNTDECTDKAFINFNRISVIILFSVFIRNFI